MSELSGIEARVQTAFAGNFKKHGELGAAVSVWEKGRALTEQAGGFTDARRERPWTIDTLVLVWSATKGIGSACLLHALQENKITLDRAVANLWPEFGHNGKSAISIACLLSHSAGLPALDRKVDVLDYEAVIDALAGQTPLWEPGSAHGYHARTFGFLIDELTRRVSGLSIADYWRKNLAGPLGLDFWVGLPNEFNDRVATIYAARAGGKPKPAVFYLAMATPGTLAQRTFSSPAGLHSVSAMNKPEIRAQPIVSFNGIGSASALARFYSILADGGKANGREYFTAQTLEWMRQPLADGIDQVFGIPTAFSAGFMMDSRQSARRLFGTSPNAFGHPGAGGSHAFADPTRAIGFSYVMNQMEQTVLPSERALNLVDAVYANSEKTFKG